MASTASTVSTKEQRRAEWARRSKHFFILSDAGKPIFSRWGDEQELATFMGVLQAVVSRSQIEGRQLKSIFAGRRKFVFLVKGPLFFVVISKTSETEQQLLRQLELMYAQVLLVLTSKGVSMLERNPKYDLRRLLSGTQNALMRLCKTLSDESAIAKEERRLRGAARSESRSRAEAAAAATSNIPGRPAPAPSLPALPAITAGDDVPLCTMLEAVRVLPLARAVRQEVSQALSLARVPPKGRAGITEAASSALRGLGLSSEERARAKAQAKADKERVATEQKHSAAVWFALLLAGADLVAVALPGPGRNKAGQSIHAADVIVATNFVNSMPALRSTETWTPLCLPMVNERAFFYAYVAMLRSYGRHDYNDAVSDIGGTAEEGKLSTNPSTSTEEKGQKQSHYQQDISLLILSTDASPEMFLFLQERRRAIEAALVRSGAMRRIERAASARLPTAGEMGVPEVLHFVYRTERNGSALATFVSPRPSLPFSAGGHAGRKALWRRYQRLHRRVHNTAGREWRVPPPGSAAAVELRRKQASGETFASDSQGRAGKVFTWKRNKVVFEHGENSVAIAFAGANYELYAVLDSMNSVSSAVAACSRVIRWLRKEEQSGRLATPIVMWEF